MTRAPTARGISCARSASATRPSGVLAPSVARASATPFGAKTLKQPLEVMRTSKVLAANQGLYNGFLAAGLVWGLASGRAGDRIELFFLGCIVVAGLYGGVTATRKILFIQALPAAISICFVLLAANA